ncbi:hypothetical protein GOL39_18295 [Sinorhizobium medicae]|nr:hypothetical protein [Sinorhizobium medicae]MDX0971865.1 hypothetical protein [Sinorhizobium medicae]MDX1144580.1 hypothetical protein [Sinorhizobium medicae]RVL37988.1 hypothetical protein CN148_11750 [Sinorhizobium meliloti]
MGTAMSISWTPVKDPDEVKDYSLDWSALLVDDTISASTWTLASGVGLTIGASSNTDTLSTVWLSGGTAGVNYELLNRVVTTGGRTYDQTVKLKVRVK